MTDWKHPTGKAPKVVTLICLGTSHQDWISANLDRDPDNLVTQQDEIWTLNRGLGCFLHDLCFVMDHIGPGGESELYPAYGARLWNHNKPIITSDNCEGWPAHVYQYPWAEIQQWIAETVKPCHGNWFHNSLAYILCYAAFIGVRELRVWGADYRNHTSGVVEDGHSNVAYWAGRLESIGLSVSIPHTSGFLNADQRGWIYGYQHDPRQPAVQRRQRFRELVSKPVPA